MRGWSTPKGTLLLVPAPPEAGACTSVNCRRLQCIGQANGRCVVDQGTPLKAQATTSSQTQQQGKRGSHGGGSLLCGGLCTHRQWRGALPSEGRRTGAMAVSPVGGTKDTIAGGHKTTVTDVDVRANAPCAVCPKVGGVRGRTVRCAPAVQKAGCFPPPVATGPRGLNSAPYSPCWYTRDFFLV